MQALTKHHHETPAVAARVQATQAALKAPTEPWGQQAPAAATPAPATTTPQAAPDADKPIQAERQKARAPETKFDMAMREKREYQEAHKAGQAASPAPTPYAPEQARQKAEAQEVMDECIRRDNEMDEAIASGMLGIPGRD